MSCIDTSRSFPVSVDLNAVSATEQSVSVTQKSTGTRSKSISATSHTTHPTATSEVLDPRHSRCSISSLAGFLVSLFQRLESAEGLPTPEDISFLRSPASSDIRDLTYCYLRTSRGFSITSEGLRLLSSSVPFKSWGMISNGKCLTAKITECPRTENACSLSDILEENPDPKYFPSATTVHRCLRTRYGLEVDAIYKSSGVAATLLAQGLKPCVAIPSDT